MTIEQSNKIIFLLLFCLVLSVFMDIQAKKHYALGIKVQNISNDENKPQDLKQNLDSNIESSWDLEEEKETHDETNNTELSRDILNSKAKIGNKIQFSKKVKKWEDKLLQEVQKRKSNYKTTKNTNRTKTLFEVLSEPLELENVAPIFQNWLQTNGKNIDLYFISFVSNQKSELVRVSRNYEKKYINVTHLLDFLQAGPNIEERNLINNFDSSIEIYDAFIHNKTITLDLNSAIGRMGKHVIDDRLQQIVLTLRQFPEIQILRILIDGKVQTEIGHQGFYKLPHLIYLHKEKKT